MPKKLRFWTNVGLIGLVHVAVISGLVRWSRETKDAGDQSVVWMNGGEGSGLPSDKKPSPPREKSLPRRDERSERSRDEDEDRPLLASAPSEIQLPVATPKPSATPMVTPRPTPKLKATPKPTPKPKPKPTPKPSPKKETIAKAKVSPKPKPEEKEEIAKKSETPEPEKKKIVLAKNETPEPRSPAAGPPAAQASAGKATTAGSGGGRAGGSVNQSQFGWYGSMLHDRFYSEWAQPTAVSNANGKNSVLVKLRIEKDGRVSNFEIVRSSGNSELDDSVKALANRVSHVDPLPEGLGKGDHYDVKINFELNSE